MAFAARNIQLDRSLKAIYDRSSAEWAVYTRYLETFGSDEFLLIAIEPDGNLHEPKVLQSLAAVADQISQLDQVTDALTITDLVVPSTKDDRFVLRPVVEKAGNDFTIFKNALEVCRELFPSTDYLASRDLTVAGIMVRLKRSHSHDPAVAECLASVRKIAHIRFPNAARIAFVGAPILKEAAITYNVLTACTFGLLSMLISTMAQLYIFKGLRVPVLAVCCSVLAVVWCLGLMALMGLRLNSVTALAFGFVFIMATAHAIHIVTHYYSAYRSCKNKVWAVKRALRTVGKPCCMCALTTAAGFLSLTISNTPSIRQFGALMTITSLLAVITTILLIPPILVFLRPPSRKAYRRMDSDLLTWIYERLGNIVVLRYRLWAILGVVVVALMIAGMPRIKTETHILDMFKGWTQVAKDFAFVEDMLASMTSLEIYIESPENTFKRPEIWRELNTLEENIEGMPEVNRVESLLPLLKKIAFEVGVSEDVDEALFSNAQLIPQLLFLMKFGDGGANIVRGFVTDDMARSRLSARVDPDHSSDVRELVDRIGRLASKYSAGPGTIHVTGHMALTAKQADHVIRSQKQSLAIALFFITLLMMIQLRSITMGLLSLIPNLLPITVVFGVMGWGGVPLDTATVMTVVVCFGFSADDTIHYLGHLRREIRSADESTSMAACLERAYRSCARALISTTVVFFFGFIVLLWAPFRLSASFGLLGASSCGAALIGDLVLMPAVILSFGQIRNFLWKSAGNERSGSHRRR
jgi:hypothetical protein